MGRKFEVRKVAMAKTMLHKSRLYSRYGKEIYMSAKLGGANPDSNLGLKHLIDKAKKEQVPNDVIKRNIQKAEKGIGEDFTPIRYEGFGPNGVSFIVDALTDNVNRTVSEVKNCFTKTNGNMGVSGCVEHGFKHLSYINVEGMDEEYAQKFINKRDSLKMECGLVGIDFHAISCRVGSAFMNGCTKYWQKNEDRWLWVTRKDGEVVGINFQHGSEEDEIYDDGSICPHITEIYNRCRRDYDSDFEAINQAIDLFSVAFIFQPKDVLKIKFNKITKFNLRLIQGSNL